MKNKNSKCKTCLGHGLWSYGDPAPMGPLDAADGMPAKECPECGAGGKTRKKDDFRVKAVITGKRGWGMSVASMYAARWLDLYNDRFKPKRRVKKVVKE